MQAHITVVKDPSWKEGVGIGYIGKIYWKNIGRSPCQQDSSKFLFCSSGKLFAVIMIFVLDTQGRDFICFLPIFMLIM